MRNPLAGLTTRGRCLVAAGSACAVCAVVLDERDLLRVAVLLVALPLLSALLYGWSVVALHVSRTVTPAPIAVGDRPQVALTLGSRFRTPLSGLLIREAVPDSCGRDARFLVGRLRRRSATTLHYTLTPRLRGRHPLGPVRICRGDPLGLVESVRTVGATTDVLVRPRVEPLAEVPTVFATGGEHGRPSRALAPTIRAPQLRDYVPGDDTRSIHWASTARRGELMVRTTEHDSGPGTAILLDTRRRVHAGSGITSSFERAISLTASMAVHLQRSGIPVRVLTTDGVVLPSGEALLDALALVQADDRAEVGPVLRLVGADRLIAVLGALDARTAAALLDGGITRGASAVHMLGGDGTGALTVAGWQVVRDDGIMPAARVWSALGQPGGAHGR